MLKPLLVLGVILAATSPVNASSSSLENLLSPCIKEGLAQIRRPTDIQKVEIKSRYESDDKTYFLADIFPVAEQWTWSIVISLSDDRCEFIGDDFVENYGLYGDMSQDDVRDWMKIRLQDRINALGKPEMKQQLKASDISWHPGEIAAFRELGVW